MIEPLVGRERDVFIERATGLFEALVSNGEDHAPH